MKKIVLLTFVLVLLSTAVVAKFIRPVVAEGTIYIRSDGSVNPPTAPISSVDNVTYIFNNNINDEVMVERSNIIIDGNGYTLQGSGSGNGFCWSCINVTIKNINIKDFWIGIYLQSTFSNVISSNNITNNYIGIYLRNSSNNNCISGNNITNNEDSIFLEWSSNNKLSGNNVKNNGHGIYIYESSNNNVSGNKITGNDYYAIWLKYSSSNTICGNNIANNNPGIRLYESSNNIIYHNIFVDNTNQVDGYNSVNVWDNGYPSGGNYWSDYNGTDSYSGPYQNETGNDGIGDTPYVIDANNRDNYPSMIPYVSPEEVRVLYYDLLKKYNELISNFNSLNATYNELKTKQEATITELNNIRNLMYIFMVTAIIFMATTVYLAIRKPKVKPESTHNTSTEY